jgi:4-amino-4-deoxy-L-arabinose transferase-like glycosyltransferase
MTLLFKKANILVISLFILFTLFRIPTLFEPTWYGDEGIYAANGVELNRGEILYKDVWDNKTPGIYHIYGFIIKVFGPEQFWIRLVSLIFGILVFYLFYKIFRLLFVKTSFLLPGLLFILFWGTPIIESNIANGENFFILFSTLGLYLVLKFLYVHQKLWYLALAGFSFGLGFLIKIHPMFDFVGLMLVLVITQISRERITQIKDNSGNVEAHHGVFDRISEIILVVFRSVFNKNSIVFGVYFLLPIIFYLILGFFQGNLKEFFSMFFAQKDNYILSFNNGAPEYWLKDIYNLETRSIFLLAIIPLIVFLFLKKKISQTLFVLIIVFLFSFYAANFSGRWYSHYFLQIIIPIILLFWYFFDKYSEKKYVNVLKYLFSIIVIFAFPFFTFLYFKPPIRPLWISPIHYYANFLTYIAGQKSFRGYKNYFEYEESVDILINQSGFMKDKNVIFLGNSPWFYAKSGVRNANKYTVTYHLGQERVDIKSWLEKASRDADYIIQDNSIPYEIPKELLDPFLNSYYTLDKKIDKYNIFKKKDL